MPQPLPLQVVQRWDPCNPTPEQETQAEHRIRNVVCGFGRRYSIGRLGFANPHVEKLRVRASLDGTKQSADRAWKRIS